MKKITKIEPSASRSPASKIRVAAYCRVSTGLDDQLISLETQKSHYDDLISSKPEWEFAGLYYDEGISGTSKEKRPALQQMITDCKAGKIDRIMTKSLSRFARNTTDCLELVRMLLDLGITIYFEKENLDTGSMESELLLSIMSSLAESESVSISENAKWGARHRFENGTFKIGYAPYGYSVKKGDLIINEEEAEWVRWIFTQALCGMTDTKIAKLLNEKQVPTRRGGRWTATTIRGILANEKYTGDCLFQKTYTDFRFRRQKNLGQKDQFFMKDHHEGIISREDFEAVRALIQHRAEEKNIKKAEPRLENKYPFTGKLICGECGSVLKRRSHTTGTYRYPVWMCKQHLEDISSCSMKCIRECDLEYAFTTMMNKLIFARREVLDGLLHQIREGNQKEKMHRIDEIEQAMERNEEYRRTLNTIMTKGYLEPAVFTQESNDLVTEADALIAEKDQLMKEISGNVNRTDALNNLIKYVRNAEPSSSFDGTLVERFLDHAVFPTRNEVVFHLKCGLCLTERIGEK